MNIKVIETRHEFEVDGKYTVIVADRPGNAKYTVGIIPFDESIANPPEDLSKKVSDKCIDLVSWKKKGLVNES